MTHRRPVRERVVSGFIDWQRDVGQRRRWGYSQHRPGDRITDSLVYASSIPRSMAEGGEAKP